MNKSILMRYPILWIIINISILILLNFLEIDSFFFLVINFFYLIIIITKTPKRFFLEQHPIFWIIANIIILLLFYIGKNRFLLFSLGKDIFIFIAMLSAYSIIIATYIFIKNIIINLKE